MNARYKALLSTFSGVHLVVLTFSRIVLERARARDLEGLRDMLGCTIRELFSLVLTHLRTREYCGLFEAVSDRFRDFIRTGPFMARAEDETSVFCVFGLPVRFEKPSQITVRFAEIQTAIGSFGIFDERTGEHTTFREGFIEPSDRNPETLALTHGITWELADLVLDAQIHDWRFLVFLDETGPLVFSENRYIGDDPDDDVSRANWRVVEAEIFDQAPDHELLGARGIDLLSFGEWGLRYADSALEDVTPQTAVITADGETWIRAALIGDYVTALADYPILCDDTHAELCAEIEADALERWVFTEIGIWLGRECETLEEAWHDLDADEQAALWHNACEQSSSACWVDKGALRIDFDQIIPPIITRLGDLQAAI